MIKTTITVLLFFCTLAPLQLQAKGALQQFRGISNASLYMTDSRGQTLHSRKADAALIPASTIKLATAWLALQHWGEQHRFTTRFYLDRQSGMLWVKGSGDPYLISEELQTIAQRLVQQGIHGISGIGLDTSVFQRGMIMPGSGRSNNPYDAVPSAVAVNFNTVNIKKRKGKVYSAEQQTPLTPFARNMGKRIKSGKLRVNTGRNPADAERYFAEVFRALLRNQGMQVGKTITNGPVPSSAQPVYQHRNSRTLGEMLQPMLKYSTNFIANQLVLIMAHEQYQQPANPRLVQQLMENRLQAYFGWKHFTVRDGAGLSRENRLSARQLVDLLEALKPWKRLLPQIEPGVYAKSGTLRKVSTLAGFTVGQNNEWKPFAVMMNQAVPYSLRNRIAKELR